MPWPPSTRWDPSRALGLSWESPFPIARGAIPRDAESGCIPPAGRLRRTPGPKVPETVDQGLRWPGPRDAHASSTTEFGARHRSAHANRASDRPASSTPDEKGREDRHVHGTPSTKDRGNLHHRCSRQHHRVDASGPRDTSRGCVRRTRGVVHYPGSDHDAYHGTVRHPHRQDRDRTRRPQRVALPPRNGPDLGAARNRHHLPGSRPGLHAAPIPGRRGVRGGPAARPHCPERGHAAAHHVRHLRDAHRREPQHRRTGSRQLPILIRRRTACADQLSRPTRGRERAPLTKRR
jgi:hypothetical protein